MGYDKRQHPKHVYHYTTVESACAIFQTNQLFASSISFLNDRQELRYFDNFVLDGMHAAFRKCLLELQEHFRGSTPDMDKLAEHEARVFVDSLHRTSDRLTPTFVFSCCRAKGDYEAANGLLSQWRAYGGAGAIALRFVVRGLDQLVAAEAKEYAYTQSTYGDVIYGRGDVEYVDVEAEFSKFAKAVPTMIEQILTAGKIDYAFDGEKLGLDDLYEPYSRLAPRMKHPSFEEEAEWRIFFSANKERETFEDKKPKRILHRSRRDYLVPYIVLNESHLGRLPIDGILIGPVGDTSRRAKSMESLCRANGYSDIEILVSETPFI